MTSLMVRGLTTAALAAALCTSTAAFAQNGDGSPLSVFKDIFQQKPSAPPPQTSGQNVATPDQVMRIEHLEAQIRQMTGTIEQLQYRNQQLEAQIRGMGGAPNGVAAASPPMQPPDRAPRDQALAARGMPPRDIPSQSAPIERPVQAAPPGAAVLPPPEPPAEGRRADVFNPSLHPNAPGAPRPLGSPQNEPPPPVVTADEPIGAPGGRQAGGPLDLSTLADRGSGDRRSSGVLPPPPTRNPSATGAVAAVAPPTDSPRDTYDLGYGYLMRKDYALAEQTFEAFLKKFPNDRRAPEAQFWLGESLFQRQRYDAAAQNFLDLSTKHAGHPKAPESLLRLAQSLEAMKQKEMACATLAEVGRKYPKAPASVKQGVEREQKRGHC